MIGDDGKAGGSPGGAVVSEAAARLDPQAILDSVPEPLGLVERDGRVIAFNAAARDVVLVATDRRVQIGDDVRSFVSPHNLEGVLGSLRRAWEGEAHTHHTEAKGTHLETVYSPVRGPGGEVVAVSIRITDVTAREKARADLAALNATLERCVEERTREIRAILATTHDGFAAFRDGERYVDVNDAYCRMVGYTREELLGMRIQEVEVGLTEDEFRAFAELLARTGSVAFLARHRRKDGRVVDLEASVTWPDPAERYSFAFLRDVTARKEAETARDRQLEILEAMTDLVGMSDDRRNVVYLNAAGRRLLGLGSIEGLRMPDLHPPRFRERLEGEIALAVRRGEVWSGDALLRAADGREIPVRQVVVPHVRPDGSIPYFSTVARDVTGEKRAQAELEARAAELASLNAELAKASRAKDEFLASMSHELRTPLTGVLGSAELLRAGVHGELNERQLRTLGVLESAGRHLLALLSDLLDLAKIGAGRLAIEPDACTLDEVCELALALVRTEARRKGIEPTFHGPPHPVRFVADPRRLRQVLANLLSNAVKFTPPSGKVDLVASADREASVVRFEVRDTGPGIAPADLPKLFRPFTQLDARLAREHGGSGLGLSLAQAMVELHGGRIEVESAPGKGSCFSVHLPWRTPEPRPRDVREAPSGPSGAAAAGSGRVLLVEDDTDIRTILAEFLEAQGLVVDAVSSGPEALARAVSRSHDLVVLDIQLPGMDGLEVLRELRSGPASDLPVLALTALAMVGDRDRILAAGADAYLAKPVALEALHAEVGRLIEGRRARAMRDGANG